MSQPCPNPPSSNGAVFGVQSERTVVGKKTLNACLKLVPFEFSMFSHRFTGHKESEMPCGSGTVPAGQLAACSAAQLLAAIIDMHDGESRCRFCN